MFLTEGSDHAVCASTVYLIRSLGTVYGVAITSAIVQTTLSVRLPDALGEIPDKWRVRPFSLLFAMLYGCKTADRRDAYTRARRRLSTKSGTQFRPSRIFLRMCSSKRDSCITTAFASHLRHPQRLLPRPYALLYWPGHTDSGAQSERLIELGLWFGLWYKREIQGRVSDSKTGSIALSAPRQQLSSLLAAVPASSILYSSPEVVC